MGHRDHRNVQSVTGLSPQHFFLNLGHAAKSKRGGQIARAIMIATGRRPAA